MISRKSSTKHKALKVALIACPLGSQYSIPAALPHLGAYLKEYGYEISYFDLNLDLDWNMLSHLNVAEKWQLPLDPEVIAILENKVGEWSEKIALDQPDVVGFSVNTANLQATLKLAAVLKHRSPDLKICFGGPDCSFNWESMIELADFVVLGEGEKPFVELLDTLKMGKVYEPTEPSSILTKDFKPPQLIHALNENLDELPYPDFTEFKISNYADTDGNVRLPVMGSVGCIRNCRFCSRRLLNGKYRYKSGPRIMQEL